MFIFELFLYIFSFITIWIGAGLVVSSIDKLSSHLKISSFAVSFFVLGILTSFPEISVALNSLMDKTPEVFIGNLIGGIIVLYFLVIPLLAIFGNGIILDHKLSTKNLFFSLLVVSAPAFLVVDGKITIFGGIFLILLYFALFYLIEKKKSLAEKVKDKIFHQGNNLAKETFYVLCGIVLIFLSGKYIVEATLYFSQILNIPPFLISLLLLSLGTNLPELSLALQAIRQGKKQVAFGDYVGSASANTLIFGVMTVLHGQEIYLDNNFLKTFLFLALGLGFFFLFSRSKNDISRKEGFILLLIYFLFLIFEIKA